MQMCLGAELWNGHWVREGSWTGVGPRDIVQDKAWLSERRGHLGTTRILRLSLDQRAS